VEDISLGQSADDYNEKEINSPAQSSDENNDKEMDSPAQHCNNNRETDDVAPKVVQLTAGAAVISGFIKRVKGEPVEHPLLDIVQLDKEADWVTDFTNSAGKTQEVIKEEPTEKISQRGVLSREPSRLYLNRNNNSRS